MEKMIRDIRVHYCYRNSRNFISGWLLCFCWLDHDEIQLENCFYLIHQLSTNKWRVRRILEAIYTEYIQIHPSSILSSIYLAIFTWLRNGDFGIGNENLQSSLASLCSALFQLNGNGAIITFHYTAERKPLRLETKMCYFPGREENQHFSRKWICIWCLWSVKLTKKIKRTFILLGGRGLKDISIPTSVCWQILLLQYMA